MPNPTRFGLVATFLSLICMASAASAAALQADADTIALWSFDDLAGKNVVIKPAGTSEIQGGVEATEGKYGKAAQFDGRGGKLVAHYPKMIQIGGDESCTIEAWVQVTKAGQTQPIYSLPPYFELEIRSGSGAVSLNLQGADGKASLRCTGKTNILTGGWHHVAGVRDAKAKKVSVYIDGKLDAEVSDTTAGTPLVLGENALIGSNAGGTESLGGAIDELRISRVARTFTPIEAKAEAAEYTTLENPQVKFVFKIVGSRVSLANLIDKASGVEFVEPSVPASNIWQTQLRSADRDVALLTEAEGKLKVATSDVEGGKKVEFTWSDLPISGKPAQAEVRATVMLANTSRLADWRINIDNRSDRYGVWTAVFPRITNFAKLSEEGKDVIAIPGGNGGGAGEGQAFPDPFKTLTHIFLRTYPCYHQGMQFNAYYNDKAGLYLATHDGKMNLKGFLVNPQSSLTGKPTVLYEVHQYPADAGVAGTDLVQDYPHLMGTFNGDWYDAAKIYRKWALQQVWAQKGPLEKRDDLSPHIKNGAYWMVGTLEWLPNDRPPLREKFRRMSFEEAQKNARELDVEKSLELVRKVKAFYDFPLLLWTNEWFDGGGDISPPRYIPQKGFDQYMKRLHAEIPEVYVSGHMQMKRFSVQLPEYNDAVKKSLEHEPNGNLSIEAMDALDKGDQIANPCWATDFWKGFWSDKSKWIVKNTDLDGFHVDELAVATAFELQCFNPNHGHPVGGGTLYSDTRRAQTKLLRDSARTVKPTFAIHHEALSEIFIDVADLAEADTAPSNKNVPMWETVYHDYNFVMGRRIHPWMDRRTFPMSEKEKYGDNGIDEFNASFAQTFIWGNQPGWTRLDILEYSPKVAQLIKDFMHVRYRNMKYLNFGEMIRHVDVKTPQEMIKTIWTTCDTPEHILPAVLDSVWKASDGSIGIVLANTTGQARKIHYGYDLSENGGKVGNWKLVRTDGAEPKEVGMVKGDTFERTDEVPARSVIVLSAVPVK